MCQRKYQIERTKNTWVNKENFSINNKVIKFFAWFILKSSKCFHVINLFSNSSVNRLKRRKVKPLTDYMSEYNYIKWIKENVIAWFIDGD